MNTATKTFVNYRSDILSFEVANERFIGLFQPGRIRGFDTIFLTTPGLVFGVAHEVTGIQKVDKAGTATSAPTGVVLTKQGTIAHFSDILEGLAVPANESLTDETIHVIYFRHKYQSTTAPNTGTVGVIIGNPGGGKPALTHPLEQVELGTITMPAGATEVIPTYWTPATTYGVGGANFASKAQLDALATLSVLTSGDQDIYNKKSFLGELVVVSPYDSNILVNVGRRLATKFRIPIASSPTFATDCVSIFRHVGVAPNVTRANGVISMRWQTNLGQNFMRFAFGYNSGGAFIDLLEYSQGNLQIGSVWKYTDVAMKITTTLGVQTNELLVKTPANTIGDIYIDIEQYDGDEAPQPVPIIVQADINTTSFWRMKNMTAPVVVKKVVNLLDTDAALPFIKNDATVEASTVVGYLLKLTPGIKFYETYANYSGSTLRVALFGGFYVQDLNTLVPGYEVTVKINGKLTNGPDEKNDSLGTNILTGVMFSKDILGLPGISYVSGYTTANTRPLKLFQMENFAANASCERGFTWDTANSPLDSLGATITTTPGEVYRSNRFQLLTTGPTEYADYNALNAAQTGLTRTHDSTIFCKFLWDGTCWQEISRVISAPDYY